MSVASGSVVAHRDIADALIRLGVTAGDTVLVHSSLKSMGYVDGGAEAVIEAFISALGERGTLVMPTLIQKDFVNAYDTWYMDKPSDTGYITEVFRKYPGALRSDQATHPVSARGALAEYLTSGHTDFGHRFGAFGDTPFCASSPWQKLYDMNAKVVMLGVSMVYNTGKHLLEYLIIEAALKAAGERAEELKGRLRNPRNLYDESLIWPFLDGKRYQRVCEAAGLVARASCGDAEFLLFRAGDTLDAVRRDMYLNPEVWFDQAMRDWFSECGGFSEIFC